MKKNRKIAIIIPYFGSWPKWIEFFLHSCLGNSSVDWIFPTDCPEPDLKGDNLKFIPFSLQKLNEVSSRKFGFDMQMKYPYKICDLKPAYGEIFEEHLEGYDFWGYGDLDLVYGNIREFISNQDLDEYDIISNHPDFVTGHLCLLRNTKEIRELYKTGGAYENCFINNNYTGFDEQLKEISINTNPKFLEYEQKLDRTAHQLRYKLQKKARKIIPAGDSRPERKSETSSLDDFTSITRNAEQTGKIMVRFSKTFESDLMLAKSGEKNWEVNWREGNLYNKAGNSILYFHFILSKQKKSFKLRKYKAGLSEFRISPMGIGPAGV